MAATIGIIVASSGNIGAVAETAIFGIIMVYAFVNLALIRPRYKNPDMERPFKSPGNICRFPLLAGLGVITSVLMLTQFEWTVAVAGAAAIGSGAIACALLRSSLLDRRNQA